MVRIAIIFHTIRPETTGVYCRRALSQMALEGQIQEVEHFLPTELDAAARKRFDLYLFVDDGLAYPIPVNCRPCAFWAIDTHIDFERCLAKAQAADFVFAAQRDGAERLRAAGIANAQWLPLACDPELHGQRPAEKQFDVSFVGNLFPGPRQELIDLLRTHFPRMFVGQRYFQKMAETYSQSRTVFNCSIANDINMRVYEVLCSRSLLVTNDLQENGLGELFEDGKHLAIYTSREELLDKVRFYLEHEDLREQIAANGRAEVLAKHTYRHRMQTILRGTAGSRASTMGYESENRSRVEEGRVAGAGALREAQVFNCVQATSAGSAATISHNSDLDADGDEMVSESSFGKPVSAGRMASLGETRLRSSASPRPSIFSGNAMIVSDTLDQSRQDADDTAVQRASKRPLTLSLSSEAGATGSDDASTRTSRETYSDPLVRRGRSGCAARASTMAMKDHTYFEHDRPDVIEIVPIAAERVLDVGCGTGGLGAAIKRRQKATVIGIEFDRAAARQARTQLDAVYVGDIESDDFELPEAPFDCIICADILEHLPTPDVTLKQLRYWLAPGGCLITSVPNVRNHTVVRSLLAGNWTYETAGLLDADHVRFLTRRELEKLLGAELEAALEQVPQNTEVLNELCRLLFENGPSDAAERMIERLIEWNPADPAAWHNLGSLREQRGDFRGAAIAYQSSLKLRPRSDVTLAALRRVWANSQVMSL